MKIRTIAVFGVESGPFKLLGGYVCASSLNAPKTMMR